MRHLRLTALIVALSWAPAAGASASTSGYVYSFASAPRVRPPKLMVLERRAGLAQGDFLVANLNVAGSPGRHPTGQAGPMILDSRLQPVWFRAVGRVGGATLDFEQERYLGGPVLIWVQGRTVVVLNQHYRTVATLLARPPWTIDGHAASIVGGNVWVTVTRWVANQNLTSYGGPSKGTVRDYGVQEYQLRTGRLIRTWDALNPGGKPNVPLSASEQPWSPAPWDPYHLNAVQPLPDGDLLVSMRNTWAVYLIDPVARRVVWTLGGKRSTFAFGHGARFAWQHDPTLIRPGRGGRGSNVELTLFNDNCCVLTHPMQSGPPSGLSEGMVLDLNTITRRASLVAAYHGGAPGHSTFLGSMRLLPGGNALVGWGSAPFFSEYSPSGRRLLTVQWPGTDLSYRALFTDSWVGTPYYPPQGAARERTVYASWNGATQVSTWEVLAGPAAGRLTVVGLHARTGFQTAIALARSYPVYRVRALSAQGKALGTSRPFS